MSGSITPGDRVDRDVLEQADAVIVGSGCAGAVLAYELQSAGLSCVVLEEGSHYTREQYGRFTPSESLRYLYRDYGAAMVMGQGDTPNIYLLVGKCVGGSSVINGGVCFRTPPYVIDAWRRDHGIEEITHDEMDRAFSRVEAMLSVQRVREELHNEGVRRFRAAADRLGYGGHTIDRNVEGCDGCCRCIFGCPHDAKRNVLVTYLAEAVRLGARVYADAKVDRILVSGGRAEGVRAHVVDPVAGHRRHKLIARGKVVILAAGAVHSPLILQGSGVALSSGQVGRNLTVHPAARVWGEFADAVDPWRGSFQSYVVDHFYAEAIKLINIYPSIGVLAATLPGFGRDNAAIMERARNISAYGTMISDVSTGQVRRVGPWPVMTYRMLPVDKGKLVRGVKLLGQIYFEAGAKRLYLPFHLHPVAETPADLDRITPEAISGREIESSAQHPLGTCRMGKEPKRSVVGPWNETHDVRNLFVVDASTVPTSVAVNPQITIMGLATRAAWHLVQERGRYFA
ncbi:MAG: GMC family oxidoreductase [Acidobacteriota bacterium]